VVYSGVDLIVERGDRIAFIGPNGAGKSTLLKMLAGVEPVNGGERVLGHQSIPGYYAQYQWEQLRPEWTVLEEASSVAGDLSQSRLRSLLGAFLFRGDDVLKRVAVLSGGEKARLILCKLLLQRPNVLLLDEPTNHLDIPSRNVLERALAEFTGAICFISHDRHFINEIANKVLSVESGQIHLFPGNFEDFQEIWKKRVEASLLESSDGGRAVEEKQEDLPVKKKQVQKRLEAEWRNELYRIKNPVQKRLNGIEAALQEAQEELDLLNLRLADPSSYQDGSSVQTLQMDYQRCRQRVLELTSRWEECALELEELEESFWKDKEHGYSSP
jgi:ATP-binding cassette subfamily F protein 3